MIQRRQRSLSLSFLKVYIPSGERMEVMRLMKNKTGQGVTVDSKQQDLLSDCHRIVIFFLL